MEKGIYLTAFLVLLLSASCDLFDDIFDNKKNEPDSGTDADGNIYITFILPLRNLNQ
jgi:hypothetical protein